MHRKKDYPYVGYGHQIRAGEKYSSDMSLSEADALLRKDLKELCTMFRKYSKDSLLLERKEDGRNGGGYEGNEKVVARSRLRHAGHVYGEVFRDPAAYNGVVRHNDDGHEERKHA